MGMAIVTKCVVRKLCKENKVRMYKYVVIFTVEKLNAQKEKLMCTQFLPWFHLH